MHHKLSIPNTLCSYSCNACIYFLSNSLRKGKAYSIQNHKINLRLIYFSTDQTHFFLTPYSWDLNLLMSQAIKMQWLILLFLKSTQSGCNMQAPSHGQHFPAHVLSHTLQPLKDPNGMHWDSCSNRKFAQTVVWAHSIPEYKDYSFRTLKRH